MKNILIPLVTTNAGWVTRLALKYVAIGAASLGSYLAAQGVSGQHADAIQAGLVALAAAGLEQSLSWIARKYVTK